MTVLNVDEQNIVPWIRLFYYHIYEFYHHLSILDFIIMWCPWNSFSNK